MRLQANRVGLPVQPPALSGNRAVEVVTGIDLQTGLIGQEFKDAPGQRRLQPRRETQRAVALETEIVVVSLAVTQLLIVVADTRADRRRHTEIERRAHAQIGIADWLAKGPYHEWKLQRYKCVLGKYVPKNEA